MKMTNVRWVMIFLVFLSTTINYVDRQVIGLLKPVLQDDLGWTEADYGYVITVFNIAYAVGMILGGRMLDKLGTKIGYAVTIFVWSLGGMLHAAVRSVMGFAIMRAILGVGEAGNFPAAVKTTAEWFPKRDRAFATGVFNSGSTIGAIVAPFIVAEIADAWGWQMAFIITGATGFFWIIAWLLVYKKPHEHPSVNKAELDYINENEFNENENENRFNENENQNENRFNENENQNENSLNQSPSLGEGRGGSGSWYSLFRYRQTYGIFLGRFVTDWVWWFFLFWIPDFIMKTQNIDLKATVLPLVIIYLMANCGGLAGGWLSSFFIRKGKNVIAARQLTIFLFGCLVLVLNVVPYVENIWLVAILIGIAASTHQAWASNIFTIVSDIYPKSVVGTMTGVSSVGGAIGGALGATFVGVLLQITGSYTLIFMIASCMYLLAWLFLKVFIRNNDQNL